MSLLALVVACTAISGAAGTPAKLDQVHTAQHSRGGFRAGFHDTGIWGANLNKPQNLTPPKWGQNNFNSLNSFSSPNNFAGHNGLSSFGSSNSFQNPTSISNTLSLPSFSNPNSFDNDQFASPSNIRQTGNKINQGGKTIQNFGFNSNSVKGLSFGNRQSANLLNYVPPQAEASSTGYSYNPPQQPVNLYQVKQLKFSKV